MKLLTIIRIKNTLLCALFLTLPLLHGCGLASVTRDTTSHPSQVQISLHTQLSITSHSPEESKYDVGIAIKNITDKPITISFPNDPVSVSYTILDDLNQTQYSFVEGTLTSLKDYTLQPGETFMHTSFSYSKRAVAEWRINAVTTYYIEGTLHTDPISTVF
ncbi:MAG: hypothetical protein EXS67_04800 [Candidatus Margulisbacteria bacterium]|nr:hypothetical protein [Candidatus Margulisiibacteriota bacterium]